MSTYEFKISKFSTHFSTRNIFGIHLKKEIIFYVFYSIVLSTVHIRPIRKIGWLLKNFGGIIITGVFHYLIVDFFYGNTPSYNNLIGDH